MPAGVKLGDKATLAVMAELAVLENVPAGDELEESVALAVTLEHAVLEKVPAAVTLGLAALEGVSAGLAPKLREEEADTVDDAGTLEEIVKLAETVTVELAALELEGVATGVTLELTAPVEDPRMLGDKDTLAVSAELAVIE